MDEDYWELERDELRPAKTRYSLTGYCVRGLDYFHIGYNKIMLVMMRSPTISMMELKVPSEDNDEFIIVHEDDSDSTRPLDLQTINFRLLHCPYGASHEAFLEDVRDVKDSLKVTYLTETHTFSPSYKGYCLFGSLLWLRTSQITLSKGVLGIFTDANAAYHTYCLDPPLSRVPKRNWHCPTCVRPKEPEGTRQILQFVDKSWKEGSELLDIAIALEETEYWEFEADNKNRERSTHLM